MFQFRWRKKTALGLIIIDHGEADLHASKNIVGVILLSSLKQILPSAANTQAVLKAQEAHGDLELKNIL